MGGVVGAGGGGTWPARTHGGGAGAAAPWGVFLVPNSLSSKLMAVPCQKKGAELVTLTRLTSLHSLPVQ